MLTSAGQNLWAKRLNISYIRKSVSRICEDKAMRLNVSDS